MNGRVLVTGATGFVGGVLCDVLSQAGYRVRAALRTERPLPAAIAESVVVGELRSNCDWGSALEGVDAVIHLAARVHVMHDAAASRDLYFEANSRATQALALAAANAGVRHFIYLSSVKVNGEETTGRSYTAADVPQPLDDYGESKWQAEQLLAEVASGSRMSCSIVRPTLVYGPGVRANFLRLMQWVDKEVPLPLGAIRNRRSLVSVWNLCDLLRHLLERQHASVRTWMVSDGEDVSTPELIERLARAMNRRARLPYIPVCALQLAAKLLGKGPEIRRLSGSLSVDITATREELGWAPPVSLDEGLRRTVAWYLMQGKALGA